MVTLGDHVSGHRERERPPHPCLQATECGERFHGYRVSPLQAAPGADPPEHVIAHQQEHDVQGQDQQPSEADDEILEPAALSFAPRAEFILLLLAALGLGPLAARGGAGQALNETSHPSYLLPRVHRAHADPGLIPEIITYRPFCLLPKKKGRAMSPPSQPITLPPFG